MQVESKLTTFAWIWMIPSCCKRKNAFFRPAADPDIDYVPISVFFGQASPFAPIFHLCEQALKQIPARTF